MNIMFLLRYDYNRKHGGDLIQAKWYESELTKYKNCHVHYADHIDTNNSAKKKIYYSLVFLFNISMIYEHLFYLKKIKYGKVIIVPIMQPNSNNLSSKNKLKYIYRSIMNWKYPIIPSNNNARELIDSAKYFIFLSEKEKVGFGSEYGFQEKNSVIIHNMSTINPIKGRRIKFLILGRIEKLKNTIESINCIRDVYPDIKIYIVGNINEKHYKYVSKFRSIISKDPNVYYLGYINDREFISILLQRTKVLVNLSLIEVSPLVDIEALNHGCKVITTINSYSHLVPDKNTFIVDPTNKPEIRETLKQFDSYLAENLDYDKGDQQDIDFERMFRVLEVE